MKATIEASAGTGKTYELTTIVAAAIAGPDLLAPSLSGSGFVLGREFMALLARGPLPVSQVVLVTYTEAATRELHGRVRSRLAALRRQLLHPGAPDAGAAPLDAERAAQAAERLGEALSEIDAMSISTMHGFCDRVLREYGFELGGGAAPRELVDESVIAAELSMRWWSERVRDDADLCERCRQARLDRPSLRRLAQEAISGRGVTLAWSRADPVEAIAGDLMEFSRREFGAMAESRGVGTYQDMLLRVRDALRENARLGEVLRSRFRLGVIDEAQDTDPVQLEIFERLFHRPRADAPRCDGDGDPQRLLVLVGDPKQSIYAFRGADLDAYLRLRGREPPRRLNTNWRSEPGAVEAVNALFSGPDPFGREEIQHPPVRANASPMHGRLVALGGAPPPAPIEIHEGAPTEAEIEWCAAMLQELASRKLGIDRDGTVRPLQWRDFAVLGRRNALLAALERRLREVGVPTILLGAGTVFESDAAVELAALLAACAEPGRAPVVRRAMVGPLVGVSVGELSLSAESGDPIVETWARRFESWGAAARRGGALAIVERALNESASPIADRDAVDALHLAELLHAEVGGAADARTLGVALDRLIEASRLVQTRPGDPRRRRIDREDAVTLRTMHTAKGLEYGIVLLPWAGDPVASTRQPGSTVQVLRVPGRMLGEIAAEPEAPVEDDESVIVPVSVSGPGRPLLQQREREEAIRLFYVAVTRARHATLIFSRRRSRVAEPSVLDLLKVQDRADGVHCRYLRSAERPAPTRAAPRPAAAGLRSRDAGSARAGASAARPNALSRPIELWNDTSFSRLTSSLPTESTETRDAAPSQAALVLRDDEPAPIITRADIAGGVYLGRLVHRAFELASLCGPAADLHAIVSSVIAESGLGGRFDPSVLHRLIERTRAVDLSVIGGPATSLGALDPQVIATEVEFCLPLGHQVRFSPEHLASALAAAPAGSPAALYQPLAARLTTGSIAGFLRGTIDLIFRHGDRWWIVDYKSTDLGDRDEDYRHPSLLEAMMRGHYILQYLLYTVAARRLLSQRGVVLEGQWLGGVIYPFVRGVDPREAGRGLFIDRPAAAVLDELDSLLRAPRTEAATPHGASHAGDGA